MEWSDLPFFLAVARTGQLARAASIMHTDATTVGRRIRRLELSLGERLFEQDAKGQALTPAGAFLLERAEAMEGIAMDLSPRESEAIRGTIRVSVSEGFGTWFISRHLPSLIERYPQLEVDLVANSGFLNPTRRETDLAVLLARPRRGPLITRKLTSYRLRLYTTRAYLAAAGPLETPIDLKTHRIVGYIPDIIYAPELRYLEELDVPLRASMRSSSINAQYRLIASGGGIGVLPCFIGALDPGLVEVLPEIGIERSFWLATHRETHRFGLVQLFTDWLVALTAQEERVLMGDA